METLKESIKFAANLYLFTLVVPIMLTIVLLFMAIIGCTDILLHGFWETLEMFTIGFYITGDLLGLDAWRIHLGLFFLLFLFSLTQVWRD